MNVDNHKAFNQIWTILFNISRDLWVQHQLQAQISFKIYKSGLLYIYEEKEKGCPEYLLTVGIDDLDEVNLYEEIVNHVKSSRCTSVKGIIRDLVFKEEDIVKLNNVVSLLEEHNG